MNKGLMYEVPEELKYEEKIFLNFTFKETIIFSIALAMAVIIFTRANMNFELRAASSAVVLFSGFVIARIKPLREKIIKYAKYLAYPKRSNWRNKQSLNRFVKIQDIRKNVVVLKGKTIAVLAVIPTDFLMFSENGKFSTISSYRNFLNSINFPIQIVMRTGKVNLRDYFASAKERIAKNRDKKGMEEMDKFEGFVEKYISTKGVNDRLFYLIIPQEGFEFEEQLKKLEYKIDICTEKLGLCGLRCKRLEDSALTTLYSSYLGGYVESGADYLSVLTMLDMANDYDKVIK
jgi:hypothetical protein